MDRYNYNKELILSPHGVDATAFPQADVNMCMVRFLNAAVDMGAFNITIGSKSYVTDIEYGQIYPYQRVQEGIKTIQVIKNDSSRMVLYKQTMAFRRNDKFMIAVINSDQGVGLKIVKETGRIENPRNLGSFRVVNLSYYSEAFDLVLMDNRIVFSDIHFPEATKLKYGRPMNYQFYLAVTPDTTIPILFDIDDLNEKVSDKDGYNQILGYQNQLTPVLYLTVDLRANTLTTIYIIGNIGMPSPLQSLLTYNR